MHFTVLYFRENKTLEDLDVNYLSELEEEFGRKYLDVEDRFIYDEETDDYIENPDCDDSELVSPICDWFQVGGRWADQIKASRGLRGERSWCNCDQETPEGYYTIVEVKDLDDEFLQTIEKMVWGVGTETTYFEEGESDYNEFMRQLKSKELVGVVSLIDCHN
jgi:hypothetical protein